MPGSFAPYRNHEKTIAKTIGRIAIDLEREGERSISGLAILNSNAYSPPTPGIIVDPAEFGCLTAAWQCLFTSVLNMSSAYIDDTASSDPGLEIPYSVVTTSSEGCVEFDWLDSNRLCRIVPGVGEGVPPVSILYGVDDDIAKCLQFEYNHVSSAWEGAPVDMFVMPVYGYPLRLQFSTLVPDANAAAYPLGFRIDPVSMIVDPSITLIFQQILTGVDTTCGES